MLSLSTASADAKTPQDTLVVAKSITDIVSLDPAQVFEPSGGEVINNVYSRLISYNPETFSKLRGEVVQDWTFSEDGKTIYFTIRPDLKFHSGNPVRAEDAAFSLRRVIKLGLTPAFILAQYGWTPENVDEKVTVENGKLVLHLDKAWAPSLVLNTLTAGISSVVDEKEVLKHEINGDLGHQWLKTRSAGSGAFILRKWNAGENVTLTANPAYYKGAPGVKGVVIRHVPEAAGQRLLLEKGDADIARDLLPEHVRQLAKNPQIVLQQQPKVTQLYLTLSQKSTPLTNPKVREALRLLIDYQGISHDLLGDTYIPWQTFIPNGVLGALDEQPFRLDVKKAKALLNEAGYPNGFEVKLNVANTYPYLDVAQALQASFAQGGVRLTLEVVDPVQMRSRFRGRQFEITLHHWSHDYNDPHSTTDFILYNPDNGDNSVSKGSAWRAYWEPGRNEKLVELAYERDEAKRVAGYIELQREFLKDSPQIFIVQQNEQLAIGKNVTGFISGPAFDTQIYFYVQKQ
ncbi:ABC transporter substrate-binding protein [Brenneria tiliae]|uniref:ABC transporter substrate-binding protein n=1 Tax=Brenneria tiliae TaxID=2914984 RepID=UPI002014BB12|nr:ABC transporter substrate-binding protein [Brenneria tiliae]MCL2898406.1 ABC transporter substrate-binding protein [Brenneria tiliae]MCL2903052.1 ABC transporter substrate-binding protein [Brenneria tiliae]